MKTTKTIMLLTVLFISDLCWAQGDTLNVWEYYAELSSEAQREFPASSSERIDLDSLYTIIFEEGHAKMKIDTSSYWKLLFENSSGWSHSLGDNYFSLDLPQSSTTISTALAPEATTRNIVLPQKNIKQVYEASKVYPAKELFYGLDIDSLFLNNAPRLGLELWIHATDSLKQFPQIHQRNDPLNQVWTPIVSGDFMILRYVHSYPDGNQTSFYHEIVLFFRRADH